MPRRPEELYVFVTSPRPDPYVNILVHVTRHYTLKQIHFIGIAEHGYEAEGGEQHASTILARTHTALEELAQGVYRGKDGQQQVPPNSAEEYLTCLKSLKFVRTSAWGIRWDDLGGALQAFAKNGKSIFDVTALKKNLLVDVVASLLSYGHSDIRTFEVIKSPNYDARDLIHSLREGRDYTYRSLADSKHVEAARRRLVANTVTLVGLLVATLVTLVPILVTQLFYPTSWIQNTFLAIATTTSIVGWAFGLKWRA